MVAAALTALFIIEGCLSRRCVQHRVSELTAIYHLGQAKGGAHLKMLSATRTSISAIAFQACADKYARFDSYTDGAHKSSQNPAA
jgi:hypothetical protein